MILCAGRRTGLRDRRGGVPGGSPSPIFRWAIDAPSYRDRVDDPRAAPRFSTSLLGTEVIDG